MANDSDGFEISGIETPTGYSETEDYFATDFQQESLTLLSVQMPLGVLIRSVLLPDPDNPRDTNRRVSRKHAKDFGDYLVDVETPYVPPIVLWTAPDNVDRETLHQVSGTKFVMARFDKLAAQEREILDGQHRILGAHMKVEELNQRASELRNQLADAERLDEKDVAAHMRRELKATKDKLRRVNGMNVSVQILLTGDAKLVKQIFADVADNAKGINKSVLADFDQRQVFNRVAKHVAQNELDGVVDWEKSRISKTSTKWLTLKDVATTVQGLEMPLSRRWSPKLEERYNDHDVYVHAVAFFDALAHSYPVVAEILTHRRKPRTLRDIGPDTSLLGSTTIIRVLANLARELVLSEQAVMSWDDFEDFLGDELPMTAGYDPDPEDDDPDAGTPRLAQVWLDTGKFDAPWVAPTARAQDLKALVADLTARGQAYAKTRGRSAA